MALSSEHVKHETSPQDPEIVFSIAEDGLKKVQEVILESLDTATTEDLKKKAEEHSECLLNQLKAWVFNIKQTGQTCTNYKPTLNLYGSKYELCFTRTDNYKENASVKELHEIVVDTIGGFKAYQPKVTYGITDYVNHVTASSHKIIEQIKKITKTECNQVQELSKTILDITKDSFVLIGNQIKAISQGKI